MEPHRVSHVLPYVLIGLVAIPILAFRLDTYPAIWFDEGYRTNAARTLAERGIYGTHTVDGDLPFDPGISSGPADIGLIALSFRLLGPGVLQARVVIVLFALLALCAVYALAMYLGGRAEALFVVLIILAAPTIQGAGFVLMGRQVLGEMPALALILLGVLLWTRHWETGKGQLALWGGVAMGVGILSKTQIAIALLPALSVIAAGRALSRKSTWLQAFIPAAGLLGVYGLWSLIGLWLTPAEARADNAAMLRDAIRSNLLTGLLGRTLTLKAYSVVGVMLTSVIITGVRLRRRFRMPGPNEAGWLELFLAVFVLVTALWFALFSVGWPRYAFAGLMLAWWLWARALWAGLNELRRTAVMGGRRTDRLAIASLAIAAALANLVPAMRFDQDSRAQAAADYIRARIPADAVVETWEWELDALSGHWRFHHPHQRYLFLAIRQLSYTGRVGDLDYDALQADPDYLIAGPFSDRTRLYDPSRLPEHFTKAAHIGAYRIYKRIR